MQQVKRTSREPDPDMEQFGEVLEKINRLQHPQAEKSAQFNGEAHLIQRAGDHVVGLLSNQPDFAWNPDTCSVVENVKPEHHLTVPSGSFL